MTIPIYYDPMIAKLITHAADRASSIDRMIRAIDDYKISGIQTTLDFCRFALNHEAFRSGDFDTKFVEKYFTPAVLDPIFDESELELLAALAVEFFTGANSESKTTEKSSVESAWRKRLN